MVPSDKFGSGQLWLAGLLAGLVAGTIIASAIIWSNGLLNDQPDAVVPNSTDQATPTLALLDTMRCPRGLTRSVQVRGFEDGFSRIGDEPSRIEPNLLRFGAFADASDGKSRALGLRSYDEGGVDKQLIDHFTIPDGTVSGTLVLRLKASGGGSDNDYIKLIPSATYQTPSRAELLASFALSVSDAIGVPSKDRTAGLVSIPLEAFSNDATPASEGSFPKVLAFMAKSPNQLRQLTLIVSDDTAVDVAALSLCSEPEAVQGVTFAEYSDKPLGPNVSILSCANDDTQSHCGPYSGDTLCSTPLPIACYKDGTSQKPGGLAAAILFALHNSVLDIAF
jgi:hypothetical protein